MAKSPADVKVSVLMPVYNRQDYVAQAIDSIHRQTHTNFEFIIFDDGSSDETPKIIKKWAKKDNRIRIVTSPKNVGIVAGRNALLDECKTQYACWQDSDDISNIHRITRQVRKALEGFEIVYTQWVPFNARIPVYTEAVRRPPKERNTAFPSGFFDASKAPQFEAKWRNNKFPTTVSGEDALWFRTFKRAGARYTTLPSLLYYYRRHGQRVTDWKKNPELNKDWYKRMCNSVPKDQVVEKDSKDGPGKSKS